MSLTKLLIIGLAPVSLCMGQSGNYEHVNKRGNVTERYIRINAVESRKNISFKSRDNFS